MGIRYFLFSRAASDNSILMFPMFPSFALYLQLEILASHLKQTDKSLLESIIHTVHTTQLCNYWTHQCNEIPLKSKRYCWSYNTVLLWVQFSTFSSILLCYKCGGFIWLSHINTWIVRWYWCLWSWVHCLVHCENKLNPREYSLKTC